MLLGLDDAPCLACLDLVDPTTHDHAFGYQFRLLQQGNIVFDGLFNLREGEEVEVPSFQLRDSVGTAPDSLSGHG